MGFAFVEMESSEDAEKAIMYLNGSKLDGRYINVTEAKKPLLH
jgi:RNA recognition motif-containing protein